VCPFFALGQAKQVELIRKTELSSMVYEVRENKNDKVQAFVSTLTIRPSDFIFKLVLPQRSVDGSSLVRFRSDEGATAAFTGGFLDTYAPATPAGLLRKGSKTYNRLDSNDPVLDAVLCLGPDKAKPVTVTDVKAYNEESAGGDCIQTGPYLVKNTAEHAKLEEIDAKLTFPFSANPFQRAFLVINSRHEVIVGVAAPRVSLFALREFLRAPENEGGLDAVEAVGMSGTRTAGLVIEGNPEITAGSVETLLPNAIVIQRR
jgi:hypothetical protein